MNAPVTNTNTAGTAKGNAVKTFAVNFIIAFAGYWAFQSGKEWYNNRATTAKTTKP